MMIKKVHFSFLTILLLYFNSCAFFEGGDLTLEKTILSGKKVSFVPSLISCQSYSSRKSS